MHFASSDIDASMAYRLLTSTVLPRPIAFVTSVSAQGTLNAAPFSFFNAMGSEPPVIVLGFEPKDGGLSKDTPSNILATKEFVVNLVDEPLAEQMNQCAAKVGPDVDEIRLAGLEILESVGVTPPRLSASPVSMECRLFEHTNLRGGGTVVIGEVLHFHVQDSVIASLDPLRIDIDKLAPISRLSGPHYARVTDRFQIKRPE